ncbi:MAG TPA: tRNA (N6-threonylcarbamoyladenosine(37)-N6)-methyltransferase TrmO [Candidatus Acidoferrales bacterium]|jgi:tRNA-Thr(GGU) m(6)t(6)A37 methyltransferase TsaA|nr:tRNA (N6-threonylcarbamoyladenosine(37)-N6)-methyltransferase TrmO [Candidatus Acidoferrales bacterium]
MYELEPIGIVQSPVKNSQEMPLLGVPAVIRVFDAFLEGLTGIEGDSHINIIGWLDQAERAPLMVRPRKIDPKLSPRGVFSMRSPTRPNPLSLSATRLTKVDAPYLYVEPLDLIDGTPIIDIKPYSAGWDAIFWARDVHSALITQHMAEVDVLAELLREAFNFHGEKCASIAVAAKIAYDAAETLHMQVRDLWLQLPRNVDPHLADGLIGISRATMGNLRLKFSEDPAICVQTATKSARYRVLEVPSVSAPEILKLSPQELFLKS